jgi:hypothetical protein
MLLVNYKIPDYFGGAIPPGVEVMPIPRSRLQQLEVFLVVTPCNVAVG